MRSMIALAGLAFVCAGCAFPAPPIDAGAYPPPAYADNSDDAQGWYQPFDPDASFVAVSWLDDLKHPHVDRSRDNGRQALDRGARQRQSVRPAPRNDDRGINAGKNYGGPG